MKTFFITAGVVLTVLATGSWAWRVITDKTPACVGEMHRLRREGYSEKEIEDWARGYVETMKAAGFSEEKMKVCFGVKQ